MHSEQAVSIFETRLIRVQDVWRANRCLKASSIGQYLYWIRRFHRYCMAQALNADDQLTQTDVSLFAQWYARQRQIDAERACEQAQSALRAWALGLRTLGVKVPAWQPGTDRTSEPDSRLQDFAVYLRQYRGNPEGTIKKKLAHVRSFLAFVDAGHRPLRYLMLTDIDAFLVGCSKHYARTTTADIGSSLRRFMRFLLVTGQISTVGTLHRDSGCAPR